MNKMKKIYICLILFCLGFVHIAFAQNTGESFVLDQALTSNQTYVASKTITLKPGFSTNGFEFSAKIDDNLYKEPVLNLQYEFTHEIVLTKPVKTLSEAKITGKDALIEQVNYTDAFGNALQSHTISKSPTDKDIVQFYTYDESGNEVKLNLGFTYDSNGDFISNVETEQLNFYNSSSNGVTNDPYPNSEVVYEKSSLSRILEKGSPGASGRIGTGHTQGFEYSSNASNTVRKFLYNETLGCYVGSTYYSANELYKNTITDENGLVKEVYTDKIGNEIYVKESDHETYNIYDDYGRLIHVLPPMAVDLMTSKSWQVKLSDTDIVDLIYTYEYDSKNRLISKNLPGIDGDIEYVYDKLKRVMMSRNPKLKNENKWSFIKYDQLGRTVMSGVFANSQSRDYWQTQMDQNTGSLYETRDGTSNFPGYSLSALPVVQTSDVHVANYFDNYSAIGSGFTFVAHSGLTKSTNTIGLPTVNKKRVLNTADIYSSVTYYDEKGRAIQVHSQNVMGGTDVQSYWFDYANKIEKSLLEHHAPDAGNNLNLWKYYSYDASGRLLKIDQQIEDDTHNGLVSLQNVEYNELGQVMTNKLHKLADGSYLQNVDYAYNIKGQLQKINDPVNRGSDNDLFGMQLYYEDGLSALSGAARYNGDISGMKWQNYEGSGGVKAYGFTYDVHNRLTKAKYGEGSTMTQNVDRYGLANASYDKNGNITNLKRFGRTSALNESEQYGVVDELTYSYTGNQLHRVEDAAPTQTNIDNFQDRAHYNNEFTYDEVGNMIADGNKKIQNINYNYLNLPELVSFVGSSDFIRYYYDATGVKIRKELTVSGNTSNYYYVGSMMYQGSQLVHLPTEVGRVNCDNSAEIKYSYEYFIKDHLGNIRLTFKKGSGSDPILLQENHYYPFGMQMSGQNSAIAAADNRFLYGGKEYQNHSLAGVNLNWYDFGARNYDAQLGRWFNIDPLAEMYTSYSPYNYCLNQPITMNDPTGLSPEAPSWWSKDTMPRWGSRAGYMFAGYSHQRAFSFDMYSDGYGGPGFGQNGTGLGGVYYDWYSGSYRSTNHGNPSVSWMDAYRAFEPYGISLSVAPSLSREEANEGEVPITGQGNMSGLRIGGILATEFFTNHSDAYRYMYMNSYDLNNNPLVEISAWIISSGVIVMPYYKNSLRVSYNDYLAIKTFDNERYVYYNNTWNLILGHIHTHPSYNNNQIGVSQSDYSMMDWLGRPITILWNNRIWMIFDRVSGPVDLGTW